MIKQPATGTVLGHVTDSTGATDVLNHRTGRSYRQQLIADAAGDHLNARTGIRYSIRTLWI